jgi:GTP cyclohydrolase II
MSSNLASQLENLINNKLKEYPLPVVKGNSIRIRNYVVRFSKKAGVWLVYDAKVNANDETGSLVRTVEKLDDILSKHYQDCVFYNHGMKRTTDGSKYDVLETRFDISYSLAQDAKDQLDELILC